MMIPTIHLDGTNRECLLARIVDATDALAMARARLRKCGPNRRDYYPQGLDALGKAQAENLDRMQRLDSVHDELSALALALADA